MGKTAFLFPGQGAQFVGMGKTIHLENASVRALFVRAQQVLGYDLAELCFSGPAETLDTTVRSQPAIFTVSLAALEVMKERMGDVVDSCKAAAGLSLGEYTSLVFSGAMDFEDGLALVQKRGEAMQQAADASPSGMVSILGMDRESVEKLCDERCGETLRIANYLCPGNIVVSGSNAACERVAEAALTAGAMKVIPLAVAGAFHTPLMRPADETLAAVLEKVPIRSPRIPVISNVDAQPHDDPDDIRKILVRQVLQPVLWEDSMRYLLAEGYDRFYEVGPGRVLRGLMKRIERRIPCEGIEV